MTRPTILATLADHFAVLFMLDDHQRDGVERLIRKVQTEARGEGFACGMNAAAYLSQRHGSADIARTIMEHRDAEPLAGFQWEVPMHCGPCDGTGIDPECRAEMAARLDGEGGE